MNASLEKGEKFIKNVDLVIITKKDSASKIGPNLWNIINRPKGNVEGFCLFKSFGRVWWQMDF